MRPLLRRPHVAGLLLCAVLLAGCGAPDDPDEARGPDAPEEDVLEPEPEEPTDPDPEPHPDGEPATDDLDELAEQVAAEAAEDAGVDPDQVSVLSAEAVTWPDGALGCPSDDGVYTQALVEGYRIILEVDGEEVHYHGADGDAFRCDDPQPPADV